MTDLDRLPFHHPGESPAVANGAKGAKPCRRHDNQTWVPETDEWECQRCHHRTPVDRIRRGRSNRSRGNRAELDVARSIPGGRKMGPLGLPWDVEVGTYARLQVKKLAHRPGVAEIARLIERIPDTGDRLRGFVWVEAAGRGKRGQRIVWFGMDEWLSWHGIARVSCWPPLGGLVSMTLDEWASEFVA